MYVNLLNKAIGQYTVEFLNRTHTYQKSSCQEVDFVRSYNISYSFVRFTA